MGGVGILTAVVFLPILFAIVLGFVPGTNLKAVRGTAIFGSVVTFVASLYLLSQFKGDTYHFQLREFAEWLPNLGIHYSIGVDGISIWLILLTTFLMAISTIFSVYVKERVKTYMVLMMILETAMLGVFVSLDMILFYAFFEATLIPMYFLIAIWGGERRAYASVKFFLYTFAGSIFMLVGMVAIYLLHKQATGVATFSIIEIQDAVADGKLWTGAMHLQALLFWAFAVAFLVKCPAFPFHTWLPDAHVEAPTAGSIILAGVLLKMGTYGFLRFSLPLFPDVIGQMVLPIMILGVIGILYGAIVAAVQPDVKKLVAYSSVAHMGFILVGIFSLTHLGIMGGAYQQLNHGISTGALFLLIGLIYERRHTRMFKDYGGLKSQMPIYAALFLIIMLSSVGLPGTNGFVGEFMALLGTFQASYLGWNGLNVGIAVAAMFGVVLAAVYLLWMYQKMFYGPVTHPENRRLKDLKPWETALVGSLVLFALWGGLYPNTFLKPMEASLGAARMMAVNPVGMRPSWKQIELEIDEKGDLVQVEARDASAVGGPIRVVRTIAPANLYSPPSTPPAPIETVAVAGGGS